MTRIKVAKFYNPDNLDSYSYREVFQFIMALVDLTDFNHPNWEYLMEERELPEAKEVLKTFAAKHYCFGYTTTISPTYLANVAKMKESGERLRKSIERSLADPVLANSLEVRFICAIMGYGVHTKKAPEE
jgi:hypothetical protein